MDKRSAQHRKPADLEAELEYFERLLGPIELEQLALQKDSDEPILYIMGCARSGTTLALQYLAYSGVFSYPTNFLSRFYYAPYIGARLQHLLISCDFKNEIFSRGSQREFESVLGKTTGALSPHEFWYFWRRFFKFDDVQVLSDEAIRSVDGQLFLRELKSLQAVDNRPLVLKGMILNWHIPFLASLDPNSYFLYVHRDPISNAQSLLRSRIEFFGTQNDWYSFKPPGYQRVLSKSPEVQTVWQVRQTNHAIEDGLSQVPSDRMIDIRMEDFCDDPLAVLDQVCERLKLRPKIAESLPHHFDFKTVQADRKWEQADLTARKL